MTLQQGVRIAGRYELVRELGKGGMGTVWLARHVELGERRVAIKFLLNTFSGDALERFRREALIATHIRTRHSVEVLDFGEHAGAPFLVMELLEGQDLRALLDQRATLEPSLVLAIVDQTARGLQRAHEAGLIHRDIKPENLFLTRDEDGGLLVKVLDFGIAKSVSVDSMTATGAMIGTVYYMSPEQFQGLKNLDRRTDVWSLACVAYEMLSGERAFSGGSVLTVGMQILGEQRPVPSKVGLARGLDAWLAKALHPDVDKRFASAPELAAGLAEALGAESVSLPSVRRAEYPVARASTDLALMTTATVEPLEGASVRQPRRTKRGRRRAATIVGVAAVCVMAVGAVFGWRAMRAPQAWSAPLVTRVSSGASAVASGAAPAMVGSATQPAESVLARAAELVRRGDLDGAHRLLAAEPGEASAGQDYVNLENAWADQKLAEARQQRDEEVRGRILAEVAASGADEAHRSLARSMLAPGSRHRPVTTPATAALPRTQPGPSAVTATQPALTASDTLPPRF